MSSEYRSHELRGVAIVCTDHTHNVHVLTQSHAAEYDGHGYVFGEGVVLQAIDTLTIHADIGAHFTLVRRGRYL